MLNKETIKEFYEKSVGHGFDHINRVHDIAIKIAKEEKDVDLQIVDAAAWLHDIARSREGKNGCKCHAEEGAKMAESFLKKINFPKEKISVVKHAILVHRYVIV